MVEIVKRVEEIAASELQQYAGRICDTMKSLAPVYEYQGGTLRGSISVSPAGQFAFIIAPHVDYAKYAENGRGEVKPKYAPYLTFRDGSRHMYASPYAGSHFVKNTAAKFR